jgi:hypothetical protein
MTDHKFRVIQGGKNYASKPQVLMTGVSVADNRYVPAGALVTTQADANRLPFTSTRLHSKASKTQQQYKPVSYLTIAS